MPDSTEDDPYIQWSRDAESLFEIGKYLNREKHPVQVRLPRDLANRAVEAWSRESSSKELVGETHEQYHLRSAAATLSLIGATLEAEFGEEGEGVTFDLDDGEEITFELDAWFVGCALEAADNAGVLKNEFE
jgi:hypothetical protein